MKRTLMIGLLVLLTISVGMLISCSGEVKVDKSTEFIKYMMVKGNDLLDKVIAGTLEKTSVTSISFVEEKPEGITATGTDLTLEENGNVMGYVSGTDIYIVGDKIVANYDCSSMFNGYKGLEAIDLSNLDTSKVTDMSYMFCWCSSLIDLDLSDFNTKKVTDMSYMFYECSSLTDLDLSSFDTSNVTNMVDMFSCCSSLTSLDVSNFDTSKVTSMCAYTGMFGYCQNLKSVIFSELFDTSNVTNMCGMFKYCSSLTTITDLSGFNTKKVTDMKGMFYNCTSLKELDLTSFDITTTGTDLRTTTPKLGYIFTDCGYCKSSTDRTTIKVNPTQVGDSTIGWKSTELKDWDYSTGTDFDTFKKPQPI